MTELVEELKAASSLLNMALGRYLGVCSAIQNYYKQTPTFGGVPRVLSDCVASEVSWISSYDDSMEQAKSIIYKARNCSPSVAPIQSLPSELLSRIFHLVVGQRPCNIDVGDNNNTVASLPKYPDFLSHVCSHWRQVAIGLPTLWTHIDVVNLHSLTPGFVARAEAHASRAKDIPLDVHVQVQASHWSMNDDKRYTSPLLGFLGRTSGQRRRIRSLELTMPTTATDFDTSVLEQCIRGCMFGELTRLVITDGGYHTPSFLEALDDEDEDEDGPDPGYIWLDISQWELKRTLLRLQVLQLDGIYFPWSSQAYHELVELRLTADESQEPPSITQLELHNMLSQSPRLRLLKFGLQITHVPESTGANPILPVQLDDLEVLNLGKLGYDALDALLGLLSPGSKPLMLTYRYGGDKWLPPHKKNILQFFKRSNITRLRLIGSVGYPLLDELLDALPCLQVLALDQLYARREIKTPLVLQKHCVSPTTFRLDTLYMLACSLIIDQLWRTIQKHPVKTIVFHKSVMFRGQESVPSRKVQEELSELCPESSFEDIPYTKPSPIKEWD